ncbi:Transcription factor AP-4 [Halotydeus destructor]|nr:Transcription factor AP-4 [Halotydeus destructor]
MALTHGKGANATSLNGASATQKRRSSHHLQRQEEEAVGSLYRLSNRPVSPRSQVEQEKRIRREIANSNERRRMQSINTGFNSLRTMLPKHDGEKLSKAAILQHTAEYIDQLEQDKTRLLSQHCQLKRALGSILNNQGDGEGQLDHQLVKRIKLEHNIESSNSDSSDEGIQCHASPGINDTEQTIDELRNELVETRKAVDRERKSRMQLEEQVKMLESQIYPERVKEMAHQSVVSVVNSESEEAAAVASLVDDEVVGETIEIETHSCPASPGPTTIVISAPLSTTVSSGPHNSVPRVIHVTESGSGKSSLKGQQPAAIALPIDMPFIGAAGGSGGTVTLQIIGPACSDQANASNTSRHNLETIVEAIRHLEGDHLFKDEDTTVTVLKQEFEGEEIVTSEVEEVELRTSEATAGKTVKHVLTVSPEQFGAIRQQVIQCLPVTSGQSRPGVIVAKNP